MAQTIRRYYVIFRKDQDEAATWDIRVADAINSLDGDMTFTDAYAEIFRLGIVSVEDKAKENGKGSVASALAREVREIENRRNIDQNMNSVLEDRGREAFLEWCEDHDCVKRGEDFLERREYMIAGIKPPSWSDKAKEWLSRTFANGEKLHTPIIKSKAIQDGILDPNNLDTEWNRFTTLASREGYTSGERGVWQKPF